MLIPNVLEVMTPENPLPLIFDSPHSGTHYPDDFNYSCDSSELTRAEDKFVDDLFSAAPDYGACLLKALFTKRYIDVNRDIGDIDTKLFDGEWPYGDEIEIIPTKRAKAGIGLIHRLVDIDAPIYDHKLSPKDIYSRIETYYTPYHDTLKQLIEDAHARYGQVWHINCHSMPSASTSKGAMGRMNPFKQPDFVLGDRDATSCDIEFTHAVRKHLQSKGYNVAINTPYKGVALVENYSAPAMGRHSLQIEINRKLYLNEETGKKSNNYSALKREITNLVQFCAQYTKDNIVPIAAD